MPDQANDLRALVRQSVLPEATAAQTRQIVVPGKRLPIAAERLAAQIATLGARAEATVPNADISTGK
jgi:hypothetical protein